MFTQSFSRVKQLAGEGTAMKADLNFAPLYITHTHLSHGICISSSVTENCGDITMASCYRVAFMLCTRTQATQSICRGNYALEAVRGMRVPF